MPNEPVTNEPAPSEPVAVFPRRVVLVDARTDRREVMRHVVARSDATAILVGEAGSMAAALDVVDEQRADAVILDVQMPLPEGLATIGALRDRFPALGIVVCSFDLDRATVERVLAQGADVCLAKPVNLLEVRAALAAFGPDGTAGGTPYTPLPAPATMG